MSTQRQEQSSGQETVPSDRFRVGERFELAELGMTLEIEDVSTDRRYSVVYTNAEGEREERILDQLQLATLVGQERGSGSHWNSGRERRESPLDMGFRIGDTVFAEPKGELRIGGVLQPDDRKLYRLLGYDAENGTVLLEDENNLPTTVPVNIFLASNKGTIIGKLVQDLS